MKARLFTENQWKHYCAGIFDLRIYPEKEVNYLPAGLYSEVGEVNDKYKKSIRDETLISTFDMYQELGDVCWYVANMAIDASVRGVAIRTEEALEALNHQTKHLFSLGDQILIMSEKCADVAKAYRRMIEAKYERDSGVNYSVPVALASIARILPFIVVGEPSLGELFEVNLKKLQLRKVNNTLHGSGDNR